MTDSSMSEDAGSVFDALERIAMPMLEVLIDSPEANLRQLDKWAADRKAFFLCWYLGQEVMNGGFTQYFLNTEGVYVERTLTALTAVEAPEVRIQLLKASELHQAKREEFDRYRLAQDDPDLDWSSMEAIDEEFDGEAFEAKLLRFAKARGLKGS